MNRGSLCVLALLVAVGLGLRLPELGLRPMHNDEGVNAMKFRDLWVENNYKYSPEEFHGPTLPYFTLPSALLSGGSNFNKLTETTYRIVPAVFGAGLILLLLIVAQDYGNSETLWAAALIAVSPAMVFYSRYYIHEMLLVFFTALSFFSFWRYAVTGRLRWVLIAGIGLGLMYATKETFVFAVAALVLAIGSNAAWTRLRGEQLPPFPWKIKWNQIILAIVCAFAVSVLFFSSFFRNAQGLSDAVRTYVPWLRRAGGETVHAHSWAFYFHRLFWFHAVGGPIWSEALIGVLAAVGFFIALFKTVRPLWRIIAFYTAWLTLIYTILPYKTPWCLLGFYHGMILLAGIGAAALVRACASPGLKFRVGLALAVGVAQLGWQAWQQNFGADKSGALYCASVKNPYVYSQTSPDILRLINTVEALARVSREGYNTTTEIISPQSYWPLPWYLRRFTQIGYFDQIPKQALAPIMIVSADLRPDFDERPDKTHLMAGYFLLRPNVFMELFVNTKLWSEYVKTLPPEKD
jgi:uncharacterized protein (TIGR03663 family)